MSEGTGKSYPLTMICEVWRVARSTVYAARHSSKSTALKPQKRGPKTELSDEELLAEIRKVLKKRSPRNPSPTTSTSPPSSIPPTLSPSP